MPGCFHVCGEAADQSQIVWLFLVFHHETGEVSYETMPPPLILDMDNSTIKGSASVADMCEASTLGDFDRFRVLACTALHQVHLILANHITDGSDFLRRSGGWGWGVGQLLNATI